MFSIESGRLNGNLFFTVYIVITLFKYILVFHFELNVSFQALQKFDFFEHIEWRHSYVFAQVDFV